MTEENKSSLEAWLPNDQLGYNFFGDLDRAVQWERPTRKRRSKLSAWFWGKMFSLGGRIEGYGLWLQSKSAGKL